MSLIPSNNYVGAAFDASTDSVLVWERVSPTERVLRRWKAPRYFYVPDVDGEYRSIYDVPLKKLVFDNAEEFNAALKRFQPHDRHESDIQPMFKILMDKYYKMPAPTLNFAFIDIETDVRTKDVDWDLNLKVRTRKK